MNEPVKLKGGPLEDMPSSLDARDHYLVVRDQNGPINPPKLYVGPDGGGAPILPGGARLSEKAVKQVSGDYTLSADDLGKTLIVATNELEGPIFMTCPDGINEGFHCTVVNEAEGALRFEAGGTASVKSYENGLINGGAVTVENIGSDNWSIGGGEKVPSQTGSISISSGAALAVASLRRRALAGKSLVDLDSFSTISSISSLSGNPNGGIYHKKSNHLIGVTTAAEVYMWDLSDDSVSTVDFSSTFSGDPAIGIDSTRDRIVIFDGATIGVFDTASNSLTMTETISAGTEGCREIVYVETEDLFIISSASNNSGVWFIDGATLSAESFSSINAVGISWIPEIGLAYLSVAQGSSGDFYLVDPSDQSVQEKWDTPTGENHYGLIETGGVLYTAAYNGTLFLWDPVKKEFITRLEKGGAPDRLEQDVYSGEILSCSKTSESTLRKFSGLLENRGAFPGKNPENRPRVSTQNAVSSSYTISESDMGTQVIVSTSADSPPVTITLPNGKSAGFESRIVNNGTGSVLVVAEGTLKAEGAGLFHEGASTSVVCETEDTWTASLENVPNPSGLSLGSAAQDLTVVPGAQGDSEGAVVVANISAPSSDVITLSDGASAGSLTGGAPSDGASYGSKAVFCGGSSFYQVPKSDLTGATTEIAAIGFTGVEYIPKHQVLIAFADSSNNAVVYDTTASPPSQVTTIALGEGARYGAYSHRRDLLYVPGRAGTMTVIDPASNTVVQQKSVGTDMVDIAIFESKLFVAQVGSPMIVLSADDLSKVAELGQAEWVGRSGEFVYASGPNSTNGRVINARTLQEKTQLNDADTHSGSVQPLPWRGSVLVGSKDGAGSGLEYGSLP